MCVNGKIRVMDVMFSMNLLNDNFNRLGQENDGTIHTNFFLVMKRINEISIICYALLRNEKGKWEKADYIWLHSYRQFLNQFRWKLTAYCEKCITDNCIPLLAENHTRFSLINKRDSSQPHSLLPKKAVPIFGATTLPPTLSNSKCFAAIGSTKSPAF